MPSQRMVGDMNCYCCALLLVVGLAVLQPQWWWVDNSDILHVVAQGEKVGDYKYHVSPGHCILRRISIFELRNRNM